jgi:TonB-dependent starch-binding outer membrane protein SusC
MKLSWIFFLFIFLTSVSPVWAQNNKLTLNMNDISLQEFFNTLEKQTGYRFFYNNDEVDVSMKINVDVKNKTVTETLRQVFENLPYSFRELENRLILIEFGTEKPPVQHEARPISQQPEEILGRVTDENGNPLPGVTVINESGTAGAITGINGEFSLVLPPKSKELTFSFIGMRTQIVYLDGRKFFNIVMTEEAIGLEEIVVIGYGSIKKSDLTGSVAVVSSKDLNQMPSYSFTRALQGRAPGVLVTQSGNPQAEAQIRVRGVGSINQSSNPIYVIDGVITDNLKNINPTDVETIQVLKDASAAAVYGADGANGVIIVTTRRGEKGKPKVSYSGFFSLKRVPHQFDVMNADEYSAFYKDVLTNKEISVPVAYEDHFREWYYGAGWQQGTNWQDEITQIALGQSHTARISGGGDGSNYSVSVNFVNNEGILLNSSSGRLSLRANSDFNVGKYFKIGESINISRIEEQTPSVWEGNPWQVSLISSPLMRIYNSNNKGGFEGPQIPYEYVMPGGTSEIVNNTGYNDKVNPRAPLETGDFRNYANNILASLYIEATPVKWLTLRTMPSADINFGRIKNWFPAFDLGVRSRNQAQLSENYSESVTYSWENQLTFNHSYNQHNIKATAVNHIRKVEGNTLEGSALGFPYEQLNVLSQSYEEGRQVRGYYYPFSSISYLGRVIYDYSGKYFLTASMRFDGNSRFGPKNRWGSFPSLSVAWKLNEDLLAKIDEISTLKIRFGWGKTGNSTIGYFQYQSLLDGFNSFSPVFGVDQRLVPALNVVHSFGNPSIKWEAAEMYNFGTDINLFDNKLQLIAEYYLKNQNDLLVKAPVSAAYGRVSGAGDPWVNLGKIQNRGFEFTGIYQKLNGSFNYNVSSNITTFKNEVKYIPDAIISGNNLTTTGHSIGSFFGYVAERIITPSDFNNSGNYLHAQPFTGTPSPGDLKFKDLNNDGVINDLDRTIIGKAVPDFVYSLNIEAFYRDFDFSVFFYGMQNFQVYNHLRASVEGFSSQDIGHNKLRDYALNYYTPERPSEKYIRADINNTNQNDRISTWFLENGSFFRIKDIQLGYSLPKGVLSHLGFTGTRIYLNASNILTFTKYTGRDPESPTVSEPLNPGNDSGTYPLPRTITSGIQIDF